MNFYKRAITSIKRRPGKSMILLVLVFILGTIVTGAIAVENAITNTDANLRNSMRPIVSFEQDQNPDEGVGIEPMTADHVRQIGALPQVSQYNYSTMARVGTPQLNNYEVEYFLTAESIQNEFWFQGTSAEELFEIRENILEIVNGRDSFTSEELNNSNTLPPIMISQQLAQLNNLSVGSIIDLEFNVMRPQPAEFGLGGNWDDNWNMDSENIFATESFQFEVIGLFNIVEDENIEPGSSEYMDAQFQAWQMNNTIFTPNHVAEQLNDFQITNMLEAARELLDGTGMTVEEIFGADFGEVTPVESVMELSDPRYLEEFRAMAEELLPEHWYVTDLANAFGDISSSMETMQGIARWILWVSLGATLLILSLLITLFLRDRRYEMGVYSALGERKAKVISQILLEIVATAFIGITLAVFTGSIISETMSRSMLRNNLIAQQESANDNNIFNMFDGNNLERMGFSNDMTTDEMLEAFEITLNIQTVGMFYAIGLGAVVLSTIVPVLYIVTLNPKKVLMGS